MIIIKVKPECKLLKGFYAYNYGFITFIRNDIKGIEYDALIAHERVHYRQWKKRPFTHGLMYRYMKSYRLDCEVKAYIVQNSINPATRLYATLLSTKYDLSITIDEAIKLIGRN